MVIYDSTCNNWEDVQEELSAFFANSTWLLFGTVQRWDGVHQAGTVTSDFINTFYSVTSNCDPVIIYEDKGHLHFEYTHHDGTNHFEIRKLTQRGEEYYDNWRHACDNKRSDRYVHEQIKKYYSTVPTFNG